MSDDTSTFAPVSFLDEDLSSVDTAMPVMKGNQPVEMEIIGVTEEPTKDQLGTNLVIKMKTVGEVISTKNERLKPGLHHTKRIGLTPAIGRVGKSDYDETAIRRELARFLESVEGTKSKLRPLERFAGLRAFTKTSVVPGNDQYPNESNMVAFIKK